MSTQTEAPSSPRVSWFELFYDLIAVAAISQAGKVFIKDPSWQTTALIITAMLTLFTVWLLTTIHVGIVRVDSMARRVLMLVQMLAIIIAALSLGKDGLPNWIGFAATGAVALTISVIYAFDRAPAEAGRASRIVAIAAAAAAIAYGASAWISSSLTSEQAGVFAPMLIIIGVLLLLVPVLTVVLPGLAAQLDRHHLEERFGLLVIIVLGESFVNLVAKLGMLGAIPNLGYFILAFLVAYCLWSIYFSGVQAHGIPHSLGRLRAWIIGHAVLVVSAVAIAVALTDLTVNDAEEIVASGYQTWTPLPLLGAVAALTLLASTSERPSRAIVMVQVVATLAITALFVVDVARGVEHTGLFVALSSYVVIADAVACSLIRRRPPGE